MKSKRLTALAAILLTLVVTAFPACTSLQLGGDGGGGGDGNETTRRTTTTATRTTTTVRTTTGTRTTTATSPFAAQPNVTLPSFSNSQQYEVFAWNELGMHCANPTYDSAVILPPYNIIRAQIVRRGNPPTVVTSGLTATYEILNNTYSYGKAQYGGFWDNVLKLFGINLARNTGLNLDDPNVHNGLSGTMINKGTYFVADGIPVTPYFDNGGYNPYQVAHVTIRNSSGTIVAQTYLTIPVSDEIDCARCHGANAFVDVLGKHDAANGTNLLGSQPVLCAGCHGDPVLETISQPGLPFLSQAIHTFHSTVTPEALCVDCHPGKVTQCSRSITHTDTSGNCVTCHGDLAQVGGSIAAGRTPWANEPHCSNCHGTTIPNLNSGTTLYRNDSGHGNMFCGSCHGSAHAMLPTTVRSDAFQSLQYQKNQLTLADCRTCHDSSRGGDEGSSLSVGDFADEHGGSNPETRTACGVCHTSVSTNTAKWPHQYMWRDRDLPPTSIPPPPTATGTITPPPTATGTTVSYTGTIQPLLNSYCVSCHGSRSPSARIDLSNYTSVRNYVSPGNATGSRLYQSLTGSSGQSRMPPGNALSSTQIQSFANWINQGALNSTAPPVTTTSAPPGSTTSAGGAVSYSAVIQPLLNSYCVSCHGSSSPSAGVNLSNYTATRASVTPGNAAGSRLYRSLIGSSGVSRMPPGGSLSTSQIQSVADWINQGALNTTGVPGTTTAPPPTTSSTTPPTGTGGTVSYSGVIQPLMNSSCTSCHGGNSPSAGINLTSYTAVHAYVTPGNAATSRLYRSLVGSNGVSRMPPSRSLTSAQIQSVADWINQGALNTSGATVTTTTPPPPTTQTTPPPTTATGAAVSYSGIIQPLMNNYCNSCHGGSSPSAGINLTTYTSVRSYVTPGNATGSRLYQSLTGTGGRSRMPPGGALTSTQIQSVANWINQGALNTTGTGTTSTPPPTTQTSPTTATGAQVSYSGVIQPLLNSSCTSCHGSSSASAGIRLNNYTATRAYVIPGNGTSSLLYRSLVGSNGVSRMPPSRALSATQIQSVLNWINQGALNN